MTSNHRSISISLGECILCPVCFWANSLESLCLSLAHLMSSFLKLNSLLKAFASILPSCGNLKKNFKRLRWLIGFLLTNALALPCKHEDLSSNPLHPCKILGVAACTCNPNSVRCRYIAIIGACWPCLRVIRAEQITHVMVHVWLCTWVCVPVYTCVDINLNLYLNLNSFFIRYFWNIGNPPLNRINLLIWPCLLLILSCVHN